MEYGSIDPEALGYLAGGAGGIGAVVVLAAAVTTAPDLFGVGLRRVGQLLFVVGFGAGAVYHYLREQRIQAIGFVFLAAAWGLLLFDRVLDGQLAGTYIYVILGFAVVGCGYILMGMVISEEARERLAAQVPPLR